jgi:hypothetical protein
MTTRKQTRWRSVPGWSRYEVSADGVVRNSKTKNPLSVKLTDSGHMRSKAIDDRGRRRWLRVHHAVLFAFKGPRPTRRHEGLHADGDKANCRAENLRWGTRRSNERDKRRCGTAPSRFTGYRPDNGTVAAIRQLLAQGGCRYWLGTTGTQLAELREASGTRSCRNERQTIARIVRRPGRARSRRVWSRRTSPESRHLDPPPRFCSTFGEAPKNG